MVQLKDFELSVNQESVSFQTKKELIDIWLAITRSYFKNNGFDVTDLILVNNDKCQHFKTQNDNTKEIYACNFYITGRVVIQTKNNKKELLELRIPNLENLYQKNFTIKQGSNKAPATNNVAKNNCEKTDSGNNVINDNNNNNVINDKNEKTNEESRSDSVSAKESSKNNLNTNLKSTSENVTEDIENVNNVSNVTKNSNTPDEQLNADVVKSKSNPESGKNDTEYHPRQIITIQPMQQKEFNDKLETEQIRITDDINKLHCLINSSNEKLRDELQKEFKKENELLKADMQALVNDVYKTYNSKIEQLQSEISFIKQENTKLKEMLANTKVRTEDNNSEIEQEQQQHHSIIKSDIEKLQNELKMQNDKIKEHLQTDKNIEIKLNIEKLQNDLKVQDDKIKEHLQTEKNVEKSLTEIWKIIHSPTTERGEWFTVGKNGKVLKDNPNLTNLENRINLVIFGDSIVKRIEANKIAKCNEEQAMNYAESGARIRDIYEQIKTFENDHPSAVVNQVILHVGCNQIPRDDPKSLALKICRLLQYLRKSLPTATIFFSGIIPKIGSFNTDKIDSVNRAVFSYCQHERNSHFIQHPMFATQDGDLVVDLFWKDRVHPNRKGLGQIARNFINAIRYNIF